MCLAVPGKVLSVEGEQAEVDLNGAIYSASLQLSEPVAPGDWVIVHSGFVLNKIDEADARRNIELLRELAKEQE